MSRRGSEILARIRQIPRGASGEEPAPSVAADRTAEPSAHEIAELRARLAHLEQLVQGLQDSVHRGSERQDKRLSDIEKRLDPSTIAAALSQDARERGL
jgi:hypothetical protein